MPSRDLWVDHRAAFLLGLYPSRAESAALDCPDDELAEAGLSPDDWWRAAQRADDEFLAVAEQLDWEELTRIVTAHQRGENGEIRTSLELWTAGEAMQEMHERLLDGLALPESGRGPDEFGYFNWNRTVAQAQGHWWARHPEATQVTVDAAALKEAFLSLDSQNMHACAQDSPRQRNVRELYADKDRRRRREMHQRRERGSW